jgi:hypothetical protein
MLVSTVEKVKELQKNGKTMYLVTLEGQNYMCFDAKWAGLAGNVVKYDKIMKGDFTNLKLIEVVGKKEGFEFEKEAGSGTSSYDTPKPRVIDTKSMALFAVKDASIAFINSGMIKTPDDWFTFLKTALPEYESFLEEELVPKES